MRTYIAKILPRQAHKKNPEHNARGFFNQALLSIIQQNKL